MDASVIPHRGNLRWLDFYHQKLTSVRMGLLEYGNHRLRQNVAVIPVGGELLLQVIRDRHSRRKRAIVLYAD